MSWDESKHPRHPAGTEQGGEFASKTAAMANRLQEPDGGFTFSPVTGDEPTDGFALSLFPERSEGLDAREISYERLGQYIERNADLLIQPGNYFGAWHDPQTGKAYLDVSRVVGSREEAARLGREKDQIAYFDLRAGKSVDIDRNATSGGQAP